MAEVGAVERGVVFRILPYGALVRLDEGSIGLIHISELDDKYVNAVRDVVSEGSRVSVKVIAVKEGGRYEFSMKKLSPEEREIEPLPVEEFEPDSEFESASFEPSIPFDSHRTTAGSREAFDSKMREFLLDSSERLSDVRRQHDGKLGQRKR